MGTKQEFPEWARMLYRGVRAGVAALVAQLVLLPEFTSKNVLVAVVTGFLPPVGMAVRDFLDEQFGFDEKSNVQKLMPF